MIGTDELHPLQCLALEEWKDFQENAEYRCHGHMKEPNREGFHFSLGMYPYVHFTSPIRRYTDLIVNRLVHVVLKGPVEICKYSTDEVQELCLHVTEVSRQARTYQNSCQTLLTGHRFLSKAYLINAFVKEFSESKIIFSYPTIKNVPSKYKEIPLSLLHTSSAASIKKSYDKNIMTLTWKRRIYHRNGTKSVMNNPYLGNFGLLKKVNPHIRSEFVQIMKWRDLLKASMEDNWERICEIMTEMEGREETEYMRIENKLVWTYVEECINTDFDVSSETPDGDLMHQCCHHSVSFDRGQIVSIQLSSVVDRGSLILSPQLINISQNSRLCLQHMQDPVQFLSRYSTVRTKSDKYNNVSEYLQIWLPILEMEFASRAVVEDSPTINAVPVHFYEKGGEFELRKWFCEERDIDFFMMPSTLILNGKEIKEEDEEAEEIENTDFICIKCDMPEGRTPGNSIRSDTLNQGDYIWVGHAQIRKVNIMKKERRIESEKSKESQNEESQENKKQWTKTYHIQFDLLEDGRLPLQMRQQSFEPKCCIELIQKSTSDKRIEAILKCLPDAIPLAKAIALGTKIQKLSEDHISAAEKINVNKPMGNLQRNNTRQREALEKALRKSFSLIHGPPGTGKTTTGIKLINVFHELNMALEVDGKQKQIIFCGQSNKSVDLVAKMFRRKFPASELRLARLYGTSIENQDYPVPGRHISESSSAKSSKPDPELSDISMHKLIRGSETELSEAIKGYDRKFKDHFKAQERKKENVKEILMCAQKQKKKKFFTEMCNKRSGKKVSILQDIRAYNKLITKATIKELQNFDVIFCTTSVATSPRCLQAVHGRVSQLIIDECGMCTETESMATIIATKPKQVVLIGDHKQLQPFVTCREAGDLGLEKSLFERYAKKSAFTFLNLQYRMHPEICKLPSRLFYENKLQTGNPDSSSKYQALSLWPKKDVPHIFIHVEGEEELMAVTTEKGNVKSCSNKAEVKQVMKLFRKLWEKENVNPNDINLMSQYNAQCSAIREALGKELAFYNSKMPTPIDVDKFVNSNVNTVVGSQGAEWDYVVFTTARSLPQYRIEPIPTRGWKTENLGFTTDEHQINVALTRAKKGLFIVGNKNLLICDNNWKELIGEYDKEGCVVNCDDFPLN
ncbi:hypothetical protein FSP39_003088 [Pinctada imbricata]|uniref:Uncharacterized protein n=1 Tax=Pinctada imbricata TaxID=66713 RepID=A0AA88XVK9_PINIB|nr:hypothetical protein FSP39_003088 [Pinctada imbricata]